MVAMALGEEDHQVAGTSKGGIEKVAEGEDGI